MVNIFHLNSRSVSLASGLSFYLLQLVEVDMWQAKFRNALVIPSLQVEEANVSFKHLTKEIPTES
jgi:hypothetical protein